MNRDIKDYYITQDVLIKAYLRNVLNRCLCASCAVGNIVAHYCGYKNTLHDYLKGDIILNPKYNQAWAKAVRGDINEIWKEQSINVPYLIPELLVIETRFMYPENFGFNRDLDNFGGLCCVMEYLGELYGIDDSVDQFRQKVQENILLNN